MFLNEDFLLENDSARKLYHQFAKKEAIIDYHCHLLPKEIAENKPYRNLTHIWLAGDHYKWRLMRANGVSESLITGEEEEYDKFLAFARTIEKSCGNPLYEWTHLELKRFFGIDKVLSEKTAREIWEECQALLQTEAFLPRNLIAGSNVKVLCTTDDPVDMLREHQLLKEVESRFQVLPSFRPDKVVHIEKSGFSEYLLQLSAIVGKEIGTFEELLLALEERLIFFKENGCKISDHGFVELPSCTERFTQTQLDEILQKVRKEEVLSVAEIQGYQFELFVSLMKLYAKHNLVMQWHFNSPRDFNTAALKQLGSDTGFDAIGNAGNLSACMGKLLDVVSQTHTLPTSIWYSLNPNDWMSILTVMGCFQKGEGYQQQHLGSAWWFNDTYSGMKRQITELAEQSLLGNFIGMLTDSRSFLSYPRHEYFRRILCELVGEWVESGRVPFEVAAKTVQSICFGNIQNLLLNREID